MPLKIRIGTLLCGLLVGALSPLGATNNQSKEVRVPGDELAHRSLGPNGLAAECQVAGHRIKAGAKLANADLTGVDLRHCDLRRANLEGAQLEWADLRRASLKGASLKGADLRWTRLQACDLRGADLRGADLSEADLEGANLEQARLEGARLFKAKINLSIGVDLTGVVPHPFFQVEPGEPVGSLSFLDLENDDNVGTGYPHDLVATADRRLFWLKGEQPWIRFTGFSGWVSGLRPENKSDRLFSLCGDAQGRLWCLGARGLTRWDLGLLHSKVGNPGLPEKSTDFPVPFRPRVFVTGPEKVMWASWPGWTSHLEYLPGHRYRGNQIVLPDPGRWGIPDSTGTVLILAKDGASSFILWKVPRLPDPGDRKGTQATSARLAAPSGSNPAKQVDLPSGWVPVALARGADQRIWFAAEGLSGLGYLDPGTRQCGSVACPAGGAALAREIRGLALAADGAIWFTDRLGDAIGRMDPDHSMRVFPLPPGSQPEEIVAGGDGRMYFTLRDKQRLGCIRALPEPLPAAPAAAASSAASSTERPEAGRPKKPRRKDPAQRARQLGLAEARFAKLQMADPEPAAASVPEPWSNRRAPAGPEPKENPEALPGPEPKENPEALPGPEPKENPEALPGPEPKENPEALPGPEPKENPEALPGPEPKENPEALPGPEAKENPEALDAQARLGFLGVNLTPGAVRHILAGHGALSPDRKSRFAQAYQNPSGLEELIARGLEQAGEIGRIRVVDGLGRYLTFCRLPQEVGWTRSHGERKPTRAFLVVTTPWTGADGEVQHDVISAYPVSERW